MKLYVVTPSYNQLDWLKLCIASVADQASAGMEHGAESIEVHHHVQDGGSTDGTVEWLERYAQEIGVQRLTPSAYSFSFSSEKDEGMYDAINKGWERAPKDAEILAHLNCDEQYLPGALAKVAGCFLKHRNPDVVFADMIVVDREGNYICHRRPLPPMPVLSRLFIPGFTCTTFYRRSVLFERGCRFDTSWKNLGDVIWYRSLIDKKCRFRMLNEYTSLFADTGENLNLMESGREERKRYYESLPDWLRQIYPAVFLLKRIYYAVRMFFSKAPRSYSICLSGCKGRVHKQIVRPTCVWRNRKPWRHAMVQAGKGDRG